MSGLIALCELCIGKLEPLVRDEMTVFDSILQAVPIPAAVRFVTIEFRLWPTPDSWDLRRILSALGQHLRSMLRPYSSLAGFTLRIRIPRWIIVTPKLLPEFSHCLFLFLGEKAKVEGQTYSHHKGLVLITDYTSSSHDSIPASG